jgi:hypothetical protein
MNPHQRIEVRELTPEQKKQVARALANLEFGTYRDADSENEVFRDLHALLRRQEPAFISVAYPDGGSYLGPYLAYLWAVEIPFDTDDTGGWMREYGDGVETTARQLRKQKLARGERALSADGETDLLIEDLRRQIGGRRVLYVVDTVRDTRPGTSPALQVEGKRLYAELRAEFNQFVRDNNYAIVSESRSRSSYKVIMREAEQGLWDILVDIELPNYYARGDGTHFLVRVPRR